MINWALLLFPGLFIPNRALLCYTHPMGTKLTPADRKLDLICYSWERQTIVHRGLSLDDVSNGCHRLCGKRVAILKEDYDPDDIPTRRRIQQLKITRWYQISPSGQRAALEVGVLPWFPDPVDYVKELRKRFGGRW